MYILESPDGTFSHPDWQPRQVTDTDWNTVSVPNEHRPGHYVELQRHNVRVQDDAVYFASATPPSIDGQPLATFPTHEELGQYLFAGHTISPGPAGPEKSAPVAECKFWLLLDKPVGRDN
ncbi:hypothetical protein [Hymenobacter cheonanensis]|uniref:hypothetical protein n=1 Tax=Hymenobacter sp. CA2-7 TaxID=3063993 RepID=UPI0027124C99|nr:hypothetical protein [Hymenobacter sp. CA2-7]MDO7885361.1 hypothetical protein [Hymenobacter sp. CA2-7]